MVAAVVVVATLAAGCVDRAGRGADAVMPPARTTVVVPQPTTSPLGAASPARLAPTVQASPPPADPLVALAVSDAAQRTGVGPDAVRIVRVEAREWPDRSLGCPRPGMGYAQAITPGYLIVVEAGGQQLEYHSDHAQIVLCTS